MTIDVIGIGAAPGDNTGDGLRTAMAKINNNFGSSANAASKLVGASPEQVPLNSNLPAFTGRNLLINGDKSINQRDFVGGQPAAGVYGYDRWKGDALGTRSEQIVENLRALNGAHVISWTGGTGTADVGASTGLSSGESFTLVESGNFSVIVPSDATDIQLELGEVATTFEQRSIGEELALCQRYYQKGLVFSDSRWTSLTLSVSMRINQPTVSVIANTYFSSAAVGTAYVLTPPFESNTLAFENVSTSIGGSWTADAEL
tara:strand:- start:749 stop:1528 length:780 start_codon:yes stop_codon:yes gene_type:complete